MTSPVSTSDDLSNGGCIIGVIVALLVELVVGALLVCCISFVGT